MMCVQNRNILAYCNLNIRIHRDIAGEMWFGVDKPLKNTYTPQLMKNVGVCIMNQS